MIATNVRFAHVPVSQKTGKVRCAQENFGGYQALTVRHPTNEVVTIAVLRGVEGNESIEHSFLLTIHAFRGLYKASIFLAPKEAHSNEELSRGCVVVCGR